MTLYPERNLHGWSLNIKLHGFGHDVLSIDKDHTIGQSMDLDGPACVLVMCYV